MEPGSNQCSLISTEASTGQSLAGYSHWQSPGRPIPFPSSFPPSVTAPTSRQAGRPAPNAMASSLGIHFLNSYQNMPSCTDHEVYEYINLDLLPARFLFPFLFFSFSPGIPLATALQLPFCKSCWG